MGQSPTNLTMDIMSSTSSPSSTPLTSACSDLIHMEEFDDNDLAETLMEETVEMLEERENCIEQKHSVIEETKDTLVEKYVKEEETIVETKDGHPSGWAASPLLPPGWMFKKEEKELRFVSQEGTLLSRQAIKMLYKFKLNKKGKPKKSSKSVWSCSEYLPEGWMGRTNGTITQFKTDEGAIAKTYKSAEKIMKSSDKYTSIEVDRLYSYPNGVRMKQAGDKGGWKASEYLPEGWMGKKTGVKEGRTTGVMTHFRTETGKRLKTYKAAASFMESSCNFYKLDIERLYLYPTGERIKSKKKKGIKPSCAEPKKPNSWKTNEYLPEGWMCKDVETGSSNIRVKTNDGKVLKSFKASARFMSSSNKYSQDDIERLQLYPIGERTVLKKNEGIKLGDANQVQLDSWKTNEFLPDGWMCKGVKDGSGNIRIKTNDGTIFKPYKSAANFMKSSEKLYAEDIEKLYHYPKGERKGKKKRQTFPC